VPIRSNAGVQGVLYLDNRITRGAFTAEDRHAVEVLGDQAGVALEQDGARAISVHDAKRWRS